MFSESILRANYGAFYIVIALNPKYKDIYMTRAKTKRLLNDNIGAIEDYAKVIALDTKNYETYSDRGNTKNELKDY